jgi:hypothetical protein
MSNQDSNRGGPPVASSLVAIDVGDQPYVDLEREAAAMLARD